MKISEQPNGNSAVHKSFGCSHSNSNANRIRGIQNTHKGTWDQRYPTPGKDMEPGTRKGPGLRDTLPPLPTEQIDRNL